MKQTLLDYVDMQNITRTDNIHKQIPIDPNHVETIGALLQAVEIKCPLEANPNFRCQYESYGKDASSFGITLATDREMYINFLLNESQSIGGTFRKKYAGLHLSGNLEDTHYTIFVRGE